MTTVLVTGGAGFIGSALARALVERGDDVRVIDSLVTGRKENVPDSSKLFVGDIRDATATAEALAGVEVVYHQAAIRSVPKSVDDPMVSHEANATGTLNLLIAAESAGVGRVVYASSSSAYGDTGDSINREDMASNPLSPYAVSKLAGEHYCRVWTRLKGLSTVSLRYFNVFGPGQHPESKYSAVFPAFVSKLVRGERPDIHWDGEQSRDFTYIDDVVAANIAAAEAGDAAGGQTFNVGSGRPKTVNQVFEAVRTEVGVDVEPTRTGRRAGDVRHTHADISKAKELLGWAPAVDWDDAVAATVRWFTG